MPGGNTSAKQVGHWEVQVAEAGDYRVSLIFAPSDSKRTAHVRLGEATVQVDVPARSETAKLPPLQMPADKGKLEAWLQEGEDRVGVKYVEVTRR